MHEELNQYERNKVWELVPKPKEPTIIGTKWIFQNMIDESGAIIRNKARLVTQGYNQEEGGNNDDFPREWKFVHNHLRDLILGDPSKDIETCSSLKNICSNLAILSQIEPKNFHEAEFHEHWMIAMHEELN